MARFRSKLATAARGQMGILQFFLTLIVGAVLIFILGTVTSPILDRTKNTTSNATANQATGWFQHLVDLVPLVMVLISIVGLVTIYVVNRRYVGR